jgi:hypothetical protein
VVARGQAFAPARDLRDIDALFGWTAAARELLPVAELVDRMITLLRASIRYARQIPPGHYGDVVPGQEGVDGPIVFPDGSVLHLSDGSPYIPHHTYIGLVGHIVGHAVKFMYLVRQPDSDLFRDLRTFAPLGEPLDDTPMTELTAKLDAEIVAIHNWFAASQGSGIDQVVETDQGPRTLQQMLDLMIYSTAQHTRQMLSILEILGIAPDVPMRDSDFSALAVPTRVWT